MASSQLGFGIKVEPCRWKDPLPTPLEGGTRILSVERLRQLHVSQPAGAIVFMLRANPLELRGQRRHK